MKIEFHNRIRTEERESSVASEEDPITRFGIQVVYLGMDQESREGGNEPGKRLRPLRDCCQTGYHPGQLEFKSGGELRETKGT